MVMNIPSTTKLPSRTLILTASSVVGKFLNVHIETNNPCVAAEVDHDVPTEVAVQYKDLCSHTSQAGVVHHRTVATAAITVVAPMVMIEMY